MTPEQHALAHRNEYDLDAPQSLDFDLLVEKLQDLKAGCEHPTLICIPLLIANRRRTEIPVYSFVEHQRTKATTPIYSPHVLILEGIFALYDQRVLDLLDLKIFAEADADICLARRSKCG